MRVVKVSRRDFVKITSAASAGLVLALQMPRARAAEDEEHPIGTFVHVGTNGFVTIEGLSPDGTHPLQKAWMVENVPQCGYCQAGQIMNAAGLLQKTKKPTDDQIDEAMGGNLCRCGTYMRIRRAIHRAAAEEV